MGPGHYMVAPPHPHPPTSSGQTDTTENITMATPLEGGKDAIISISPHATFID